MNTKIVIVPLAVLLTTLMALAGEPALAAQPACGDVLVADTELEGNLDCPPFTHGLVIGAHGVTLDLNGFHISGANVGVGVFNIGYNNVTIRNGSISGFRDGVRAYRVKGLSLDDLQLTGQRYSSIVIIDARDVRVTNSFVSLPPGGGIPDPATGHVAEAIRFANVDDGRVANVFVEGGYFGVLSICDPRRCRDVTIMDNVFDDVQTGVRIVNNVDTRVMNNLILGTDFADGCYSGIDIVGDRPSHRVLITDNDVTGCAQGIFAATAAPSTELTIRHNLTYANGDGILLIQVEDSQLLGNEAFVNEWVGLALVQFSQGNRILSNIATGNGLLDMGHDESSTPNQWMLNVCDTSEGADVDCP